MGDFDFMGGESLDDAMDLGQFRDGLGGLSGEDGFDDLGGGGLDDLDFGGGKSSKGKGGKSDKNGSKSDKKSGKSDKKGGKKAVESSEDLDDLFGYTPKVSGRTGWHLLWLPLVQRFFWWWCCSCCCHQLDCWRFQK
jgi:hypothetical protein